MLYLYDNAIVEDLKKSFNPDNVPNPIVSVVSPENALEIAAQLQNDDISLPLVAFSRNENIPIDMTRYNFTVAKKGIIAEYDTKENLVYLEKAMPVDLKYDMIALTNNQADMDEIMRELLFKYSQQYFLTIHTPYEAHRPIRFGIEIMKDEGIEQITGSKDYHEGGKLYQSTIHLQCHGCVLLSYTPRKVTNLSMDSTIETQ